MVRGVVGGEERRDEEVVLVDERELDCRARSQSRRCMARLKLSIEANNWSKSSFPPKLGSTEDESVRSP